MEPVNRHVKRLGDLVEIVYDLLCGRGAHLLLPTFKFDVPRPIWRTAICPPGSASPWTKRNARARSGCCGTSPSSCASLQGVTSSVSPVDSC